jgi:hypothetical protein
VETKTCTKCKKIKLITEFGVDNRLKNGIRADCKECNRAAALNYRNNNLEKARASCRNWAAKNPKKATELKLRWARENKEKVLQQGREYHHRNRNKRLASQKAVRAANPKKYAAKQREWRKNNMDYVLSINALRLSNKLQRTPKWLTQEDKEKIRLVYKEAKCLTETTGEQYHVDHIIPLQGELVSGLHVPNNLQILHWKDNLSKRHKYTP